MSPDVLFEPLSLVKAVGLLGIFLIVFAESGLFFGFFLPGDSLLFAAGLLSAEGFLPIGTLVVGVVLAAILGDAVGYWSGRVAGERLFTKEDSLLFRRSYAERARAFFIKHGRLAIVIARFVPVVRTFTPIIAGVGRMSYPTFLTFNVLGGLFWGAGFTLAGFFLGRTIPSLDRYIVPITAFIIFASFIPNIVAWLRRRRTAPPPSDSPAPGVSGEKDRSIMR